MLAPPGWAIPNTRTFRCAARRRNTVVGVAHTPVSPKQAQSKSCKRGDSRDPRWRGRGGTAGTAGRSDRQPTSRRADAHGRRGAFIGARPDCRGRPTHGQTARAAVRSPERCPVHSPAARGCATSAPCASLHSELCTSPSSNERPPLRTYVSPGWRARGAERANVVLKALRNLLLPASDSKIGADSVETPPGLQT